MADQTADTPAGNRADLDERKVARGAAIGLPLVTIVAAVGCGVTLGPPMAILVLAAGMLLGVIGLFWASLRILSGDAPLSPELEALDATAHVVDALASRKKMLVRALKDLDNERALGKLDDEDYAQLSATYRAELKEVLARIDATLEPHRPRAEKAAHAYLAKAGLADSGYRGSGPPSRAPDSDPEPPRSDAALADDDEETDESEERWSEPAIAVAKSARAGKEQADTATLESAIDAEATTTGDTKRATEHRLACSKCSTSNEPDATFCKRCGTSLATTTATAKAESSDEA